MQLRFFMPVWDYAVATMMQENGHEIVIDKTDDFDVLLLTGGADVNPQFYKASRLPETMINARRDFIDLGGWKLAGSSTPKVGICRGGQFLNVMSGGKMWQHVDGHRGVNHDMRVILPGEKPFTVMVNSTHHQMMIPDKTGLVLGVANCSTKVQSSTITRYNDPTKDKWDDIEVVWYAKSKSLCFQPHPEYKTGVELGFRKLFFNLIERYIVPAVKKA